MNYFEKMRGSGPSPPGVGASEVFWSWLGSFLGISAVALLHAGLFEPRDLSLLIGSFGASAVLLYGAVRSPLAQPRNLMGGHVLSALIGVTAHHCWAAPPGWPRPWPCHWPSPSCTSPAPCIRPAAPPRSSR